VAAQLRGLGKIREDSGFWELLVYGNPPDPPAGPDPPGKSGSLARLSSRSHHPPPSHQAARKDRPGPAASLARSQPPPMRFAANVLERSKGELYLLPLPQPG